MSLQEMATVSSITVCLLLAALLSGANSQAVTVDCGCKLLYILYNYTDPHPSPHQTHTQYWIKPRLMLCLFKEKEVVSTALMVSVPLVGI